MPRKGGCRVLLGGSPLVQRRSLGSQQHREGGKGWWAGRGPRDFGWEERGDKVPAGGLGSIQSGPLEGIVGCTPELCSWGHRGGSVLWLQPLGGVAPLGALTSHTLHWAQLQHPPLRRTGQNTGGLYMATEASASPEDTLPQAVAGGKGRCPRRGGSRDTPVYTGLLPDREASEPECTHYEAGASSRASLLQEGGLLLALG